MLVLAMIQMVLVAVHHGLLGWVSILVLTAVRADIAVGLVYPDMVPMVALAGAGAQMPAAVMAVWEVKTAVLVEQGKGVTAAVRALVQIKQYFRKMAGTWLHHLVQEE